MAIPRIAVPDLLTRPGRRYPGGWAAALLLLVLAAAGQAADQPAFCPKAPPGSLRAKLGSALQVLVDTPTAAPALAARTHWVPAHAVGRVSVRLDAAVTPAVLQAITACGAIVTASYPSWRTILVEATPAQLLPLAQVPGVDQVLPALAPWHHYTNQADAVIATDQVRTGFGVTGAGRTIGVISDSIHDTAAVGTGTVTGTTPMAVLSGTHPQVAGNLAPAIQVIDFGPGGGTDEGEAMLEEIYHLAPGASLAFASANTSQPAMAANLAALHASAGATIVCDDVLFPDEPWFQDGPIAQAEDALRAAGVLAFSAAGNNGAAGIIGPYVSIDPGGSDPYPNGIPGTGAHFHNWGIGGATPSFLPVTIPAGVTLDFLLEWSQPYHSYNLGAGSQADYDLYVYATPSVTASILTASTSSQGTTGAPAGDPFEGCAYRNATGSPLTVYVAVDHYQGVTDSTLRVLIAGDGAYTAPAQAPFGGPTTVGHCTAAGAVAVAAVYWATPTTLEPYTSTGGWGATGVPFFYDTTGAPLPGAPQRRNKPELTAPDGVHTSVFGILIPGDSSGLPSFFGTSAATPNAAAAAALVWLAQPGLTSDGVIAHLEATATDITTAPASAGPDAVSGYGLVNAYAASYAELTGITTSWAAGTYAGGTVPLLLHATGTVTVHSPAPQLTLSPGMQGTAAYASGSGTNLLAFAYPIQLGDAAAPLDVTGILSGASLVDAVGRPVSLSLPSPGAPGSLSAATALTIAATAPSVTVTVSPAAGHTPSFTFTLAFSRPVTGLSAAAVSVTNGTAGTLSGSGASYQLPVTATAQGTVRVSLAAGAASDAYGYPTLAGSGSALYDTTPPSVTLSATPGSVASGGTVQVAATFSEPVTGVTAAAWQVTNGTLTGVAGSGAAWTATVTVGSVGTCTVSLAASPAITDAAGNALATGASVQVGVTGPSSTGGGGSSCGLGSLAVLGVLGWWGWRRRRG